MIIAAWGCLAGPAEGKPDPSCTASGGPDVECVAARSGCDQTTVELRRSVHRARTEPDYRFAVGYAKPAIAPEGRGVIEEREPLAQGSGNRHRDRGSGFDEGEHLQPPKATAARVERPRRSGRVRRQWKESERTDDGRVAPPVLLEASVHGGVAGTHEGTGFNG